MLVLVLLLGGTAAAAAAALRRAVYSLRICGLQSVYSRVVWWSVVVVVCGLLPPPRSIAVCRLFAATSSECDQ